MRVPSSMTVHVQPCMAGPRTCTLPLTASNHAQLGPSTSFCHCTSAPLCSSVNLPLPSSRLHACMMAARVSIHAWPDSAHAHASVRAHLQPCMACSHASPAMHGSTAHVHQCEPASSHAWLARARLQPCMARRRTCISERPLPAMHG
jgi:hypothetical protein